MRHEVIPGQDGCTRHIFSATVNGVANKQDAAKIDRALCILRGSDRVRAIHSTYGLSGFISVTLHYGIRELPPEAVVILFDLS